MLILEKPITIQELQFIEDRTYFEDMMKCVVDVEKGIIAVNADLHSDLEQLLLDSGSLQRSLYGINILYENPYEVEFDSLINIPRNRDAGFPRVGRGVADPVVQERINEVVTKWIIN